MASSQAGSLLDELVAGYPRLAGKMELLPEIAIFRRFGGLNAQNLLYLQAELTFLERELRKIEKVNSEGSDRNKQNYATDWWFLGRNADLEEDGEWCEQWSLVKKARQCLKEYNETLVHQSIILRLEEPSAYDMNSIRHFLYSKNMGTNVLKGYDFDIWGTMKPDMPPKPDLVTLCPRAKTDIFSRWVTDTVVGWFFDLNGHRFKKPSVVHGVVSYSDALLHRITFWLTTTVASLLPVLSIAILFSVDQPKLRLVIVGVFNVVLSVCLTIFTTATRSEIFSVSAAFSAVQVVFIAVSH